MTLVRMRDILEPQLRGQSASGAFTCYDIETARAVLESAARIGRPVILLVSEVSLRRASGDAFLAAILSYAERMPGRACIQVDHIQDLDLIERALEIGVTAVMADGSRLTFEENVAFVQDAAALALRFDADLEAELGRVEGDEDVAGNNRPGTLTDPAEAFRFIEGTGANCLAVSIGNVHGHYRAPPILDWSRLREISAVVRVPLALHGASGVPDQDVRRAIELGIAKVNVNTDLRAAYLDATATVLGSVRETGDVSQLHELQIEAMSSLVTEKLELYDLGSAND
jgi:ketose-bisphosphate aldolase